MSLVPSSSRGGSLPAPWAASDNNLVIPVAQLAGGTAGAPYAIVETEVGVIANRASGFVSDWEVFDLGKPGVGYAKATITAADADGLAWGTDIAPLLQIAVSPDVAAWTLLYGIGAATPLIALDLFGTPADPVGAASSYILITPRAIRFNVAIIDLFSGMLFGGAANPALTFTFDYTAG